MEKEIHPMILEYTTKKDNETIKLPLNGKSLKAEIDWGDGSPIEIVTSKYPTHRYLKKGVYEVKVSGTVPRIDSYELMSSERQYLTGIKSWGKLDGLTSMADAFYYCENLKGELPNDDYGCFENVTDFSYCFFGCSGLTGSIPENLFANRPNVTKFYSCFYYCTGLTSIPTRLFSNCPNVTNFEWCFGYCRGLTGTTPVDILEDGTRIELWERVDKEGYPNTICGSYCFGHCSGLSNYSELPSGWK